MACGRLCEVCGTWAAPGNAAVRHIPCKPFQPILAQGFKDDPPGGSRRRHGSCLNAGEGGDL